MRRGKVNLWWLIAGISGLSGLGWFVNTFAPDQQLHRIAFFSIFLVSSFSLMQYILANMRQALLLSLGLTIFLLLRYLGLREMLYPLLLVACLISLELGLRRR